MNAPKQNEYLLLFRGDEWFKELSAAELQEVMDHSKAWFNRLAAQGKVKGGQPLVREGAVVSARTKGVIADGPFIESKEAIGGYLLLSANSLDEAVAIARTSPALSYGTSIEVRPIAGGCPLDARACQLRQEDLSRAAA